MSKIYNPQDQFGNKLVSVKDSGIEQTYINLESTNKISAKDVWSDEVPAYIIVASISSITGNYELNDLAYETSTGFTYQYNGTSWTSITLTEGTILKNKLGIDVLKYHHQLPTSLIQDGNNYRYYSTLEGKQIKFVSPENKIVNSIPSRGYVPQVIVGSTKLIKTSNWKIDYNNSCILSRIQFNSLPKINVFEYLGRDLSNTSGISVITNTHELTQEEKSSGIVTIEGVTSLVKVTTSNGNEIICPYEITGNTLTLTLFNPDADSIDKVYEGELVSNPIIIKYL